jgi:inorganic pyrophosphatase
MPRGTSRLEELLHSLFQAHPWHGIEPRGGRPGVFTAFIEIVPTDTVKYELDKASGHLKVDRPQLYSNICPTLYGFIPQTYCGTAVAARCAERTGARAVQGDGDPLDICVLTEKPIAHGNILVRARAIGGLRMIDANQADDKIIAVLESDLHYGHLEDVADCPPAIVDRLQHYFLSYKRRPNDPALPVTIAEVYDRAEALEVIDRSFLDYAAQFGDPGLRIEELEALLKR